MMIKNLITMQQGLEAKGMNKARLAKKWGCSYQTILNKCKSDTPFTALELEDLDNSFDIQHIKVGHKIKLIYPKN